MAKLDLTLKSFRVPGFDNFFPEFGTKEDPGKSVSSVNVVKNAMMPFTRQRPVVAVESSTTTDIEADCTIVVQNSGIDLVLGSPVFAGCTVSIQAGYTSGNSYIKFQNYNGEQEMLILSPGDGIELTSGIDLCFHQKTRVNHGVVINTDVNPIYNRRYLYPAVFPLANRNAETNYKVVNDESHPKDKLYIRAGATLPSFYVDGVGLMQYHTDVDVTLSAADCDDTCNGFESGKDYFVYLVYSPYLFADQKNNLGFKISLNDPDGISIYGNSDYTGSGTKPIKAHAEVEGAVLTDGNCYCIGGFHTVCSDKTDLAGEMVHPFIGYSAGDVHPYSVWDRYHRPESTTVGMSFVPTIGKWCGIYLACERTFCKTGAWGVYGGTYPQNDEMLVSVYNKAYATGASGSKYHCLRGEQLAGLQRQFFPDVKEFVALSLGTPQSVNIAGSADPGKSGGHKATNGKDMVSYCGVEDTAGVLWQWGRAYGGKYAADTWVNNFDANDHDVGGQSYQQSNCVLLGGYWSHGVPCGSRTAYWNNGVLSLGGTFGFRLLSESAKN